VRQHNIHEYIYRTAQISYPHINISMDIFMDIHIHGKPAVFTLDEPIAAQ